MAARRPASAVLEQTAQLNLLLAANRFEAIAQTYCQEAGLSVHQARVLFTMCQHPDAEHGLPMRVIADGLVNRASDTTRLVDRLVDAGYATREASPGDRRVVLVKATPAAFALVARMDPELQRARADFWKPLTPAELGTLDALLTKVLWTTDDTDQGGT
jgi:DNA-binding MarR family transcriptional regulator